MGVRGLTTYINANSRLFFVDFKLHDSIIVIDGNSLAAVLYCDYVGSHSPFGGDYNSYADVAESFVEELRKCNIDPIFVFDGGYELKKALTVRKRNKLKVHAINRVTPDRADRDFFPLMLRPVLQERLIELGVTCLQSDFEADCEIAAIAKRLNAPVLSNDSDFFIFDVPFIPLSRFSFKTSHCKLSDSSKSFDYLKCEIYYVENFLKSFGGLKKDMLPLIATILGNDYINRSLFKNFFCLIKLDKNKKVKLGQRRIGGTIKWLKNETFDSALKKILVSLPKKKRQKVKNQINSIVRGYSNVSTCLDDCIPQLKGLEAPNIDDICDIKNLSINDDDDSINESSDDEECGETVGDDDGDGNSSGGVDDEIENDVTEVEEEEEEEAEAEAEELISETLSCSSKQTIPEWLLKRSRKCLIAPPILTLMSLNTYFCIPQMEDCQLPHAGKIGLPILKFISGIILRTESFVYWHRHGSNSYRAERVEPHDCDLSIDTLNQLPSEKRKNILLDALGVDNYSILDSYPESWQLLFIAVIYWIKNRETSSFSKPYHIHAVILMAIAVNIIFIKIGHFSKIRLFVKKFGNKVKSLVREREKMVAKFVGENSKTFLQVLTEVTIDDCLIVYETLYPLFEIDIELKKRPRTFKREVVHCFAELQTVLDLTQMLNSLLLSPLVSMKISKFYNGTFLYNIAVLLNKQPNALVYLRKLFSKTPSLLNLQLAMYGDLMQFLGGTTSSIPCVVKRRRHKQKKNRAPEDGSDDDFYSCDEHNDYFDENNKFSLLPSS